MNEKDKQVLQKIYQHLTAVLTYCEACDTLENLSSQAYPRVFSANFAASCVKNTCLVCNKIMLENPHIFIVKTGSETFQENSMRVEACVFNLMQIGALAKISLSEEAKAEISTIPWKQLYGMRNRMVHGYSGVDMRIVWDTISSDLPQLRQEIEPQLN